MSNSDKPSKPSSGQHNDKQVRKHQHSDFNESDTASPAETPKQSALADHKPVTDESGPVTLEQINQLPSDQKLLWDKFMDILISRASEHKT